MRSRFEGDKVGTNPVLAKKRIDDAASRVATVEEKLQEEFAENRGALERFYNNLALFAGGTIALSVTYLGYLRSTTPSVVGFGAMVASWCALLICAVCSLFSPFLYAYYMTFARNREYAQSRMDQRQTEADMLPSLPIVNLRTPREREEFRTRLRGAAGQYEKDAIKAEKRETLYWQLWQWSGAVARVTFLSGLALLVAFAIANA
ncbi:MAG: hypothetical protein HY508_13140 [Acidobacteria bacterium]|nr:hypothetical protein [Acidobacteriota bacterium]